MSNDLRDQLLKAGLVTEEQVTKAEQQRNKPQPKPAHKSGPRKKASVRKSKATPRKRPAGQSEAADLAKAYAAREKQERREQETQAQAAREAEARRREVKGKLRELVEQHQQNLETADIPYRFTVSGKVKQVYVTEPQRQQLAAGELSIALLDGKRHILPPEIGEQILALDPERVVIRHDPSTAAEDDIPEDLVW